MNKLDIGGMSSPSSISFFSDDYYVEVDTKENHPPIVKKSFVKRNNKVLDFLMKIPFVRGIVMLFTVVAHVILTMSKKLLLVLLLVIIYVWFAPQPEPIEKGWFWDNYIGFVFYLGILMYIHAAVKNHGAEHKVISAYESSGDLSFKNVKKQPREHPRCGGTFVIWFYIVYFLFFRFIFNLHNLIPDNVVSLIAFSFGFELFKLARKEGLGLFFFAPSFALQKLTAREPDDKTLKKAIRGFKKLIKKEGELKS